MTIEEATDVALKFQKKVIDPPPKKIGSEVEKWIEYYSDESFPLKNKPGIQYTIFESRSIPNKEVMEFMLENGQLEPSEWENWARRLYLNGQIKDAIKIINKAISTNPGAPYYFLEKLKYQTESGDYLEAEKSLNFRKGLYFSNTAKNSSQTMFFLNDTLASISLAKGNVQEAESYYLKALVYLEKMSKQNLEYVKKIWIPRFRVDVKLALARCLMFQGRLMEAENWVRETFHDGDTENISHKFIALSEIFFEQGRLKDSELMARTALRILKIKQTADESMIIQNARLAMSKVLFSLGQWERSIEKFEEIEIALKDDKDIFNSRYRPNRIWGYALSLNGNSVDALNQLEIAYRDIEKKYGSKHYLAHEVNGFIAIAKADEGKIIESLDIFNKTVPILLTKYQEQDGEGVNQIGRKNRLQLIIEKYILLLTESEDEKDIEKAFTIASAFQSRNIGKAMAKNIIRQQPENHELTDLIRKKQDLSIKYSAQLNSLSKMFNYNSASNVNKKTINNMKSEIESIKTAISVIDNQILNEFSDLSNFINTDFVDSKTIKEVLSENEAIITTFIGKTHLFVWSFQKNGPVAFASTPLGRQDLVNIVTELLRTLERAFKILCQLNES